MAERSPYRGPSKSLLPSLMTTYDDRLFLEGDPFLGGQNARKIYAEMGVVDAQRQYRGAYNLMRGKYSPALFEAVTHNLSEFQPGQEVITEVTIRSRGPIERDAGLHFGGLHLALGAFLG